MGNNKHYDMFQSLHLRNLDDSKVYARIDKVVELLEDMDPTNEREVEDKISELLGEAESTRVFELICLKLNVDATELIKQCQIRTGAPVSPRLLLHVLLFSISYVSNKLQVDQHTVELLIEELSKSFTVDSPLSWLKDFVNLTAQERKHQERTQEKLMKSGYSVNQATDTAEERRVKTRTKLQERLSRFFRGLL